MVFGRVLYSPSLEQPFNFFFFDVQYSYENPVNTAQNKNLMNTKTALLFLSLLMCTNAFVHGQKLVRFSNITELGVGFQLGKTSQTTEMPEIIGGDQTIEIDGYSIPSPRLVTSFGVMIWELVFVGAGAGYAYQPSEGNKPYQHNVSGFGQARLHFAKGRFRPFTDLRLGYNYTLNEAPNAFVALNPDNLKWDGLMIEPALGFAVKLSDKFLFNTSLAYQFLSTTNRNELTYTDINGNELGTFATNQKQHRLMLNVGFTFK